jgi:geranylgeranyl transferase type-1 subunit beta
MRGTNFIIDKHLRLLKLCLNTFPSAYAGLENNRLTLLFFIIGSLDVLNRLEAVLSKEEQAKIIQWIYSLQLTPESGCEKEAWGFRGSTLTSAVDNSEKYSQEDRMRYESAHIAQTYSALCCLLILRDDLSRVDKTAVLTAVQMCQTEEGSFCAFGKNTESDMRFVFCAAAICYILNDFTYIDVERMCSFIQRSITYEGGFGQGPGLESHGGSTYCAIASLALLGRLYDESVLSRKQIEHLKKWAIFKQEEAFHGRTNKPDDSCYAFWIGATLKMLNSDSFVNVEELRNYLMAAQDELIGGFSKFADSKSDVLHTYFSLAGLSLFNEPLLTPVYAPLNVPMRAHEHLSRLRRNVPNGAKPN